MIAPGHALPVTAPGTLSKVLRSAFQPSAPIDVEPRLELAFQAWGLRFARGCNQRAILEAMRGRAAFLNRSRELRPGVWSQRSTWSLRLVLRSLEDK